MTAKEKEEVVYLRSISPKIKNDEMKKNDWRYRIMDLSEIELKEELKTWSRIKCIFWLYWNDPNGIWTDSQSRDEGYPLLTTNTARDYIFMMLTREER